MAGDFISTADGKQGFIEVLDERQLLVHYVDAESLVVSKHPIFLLRLFKDRAGPELLGYSAYLS